MSTESASQPNNNPQNDEQSTQLQQKDQPSTEAPPAPQVYKPKPPHVPIPIPDVVSPGRLATKRTPSAAAAEVVEEFVQTLQFKEQISALSQQADEYMNIFENFYSEAKKIQKALDAGSSYSPPNCTVKLNHQPIDRVKTATAYQACSNRLGALIQSTKLEMGTIELEMMCHNSVGRKADMVEIMAATLDLVAKYAVVIHELTVEPNDLAASYLMKHHKELFDFSATGLGLFARTYKKVNECGIPIKSTRDVYNFLFARAATSKEAEAAQSNKEAPADPQSKTPQSGGTVATPGVAIELFPASTNKNSTAAHTIAPANNQQPPQSTAQSTTSSLTTQSGSAASGITKITFAGREFEFSNLSEEVLKSIPGFTAVSDSVGPDLQGFTPASALLQNKTPRSDDDWPELREAYGKTYLSREYTEEEKRRLIEIGKEADEAMALREREEKRNRDCTNWAAIDSIRSKTSFVETPSKQLPPQGEIPAFPTNVQVDSTNTSLPPIPIYAAELLPNFALAVQLVHDCMMTLFVRAPSVFIVQWETNAKANQISRLASKARLDKSGNKTAKLHFEEAEKLDAEVARRNAAAKKEASKRRAQSEEDSRAAKRTKQTELNQAAELKALKKRAKSLETEIASLDKLIKAKRGSAKGPGTKTPGSSNRNRNGNLVWERQRSGEGNERQNPVEIDNDSTAELSNKQPGDEKIRKRYSGPKKRKKKNTGKP